MGEKMVNFVGYMNGEAQGCQTAWFDVDGMKNIHNKAQLYLDSHALKLDEVIIFLFDDRGKRFIYIDTVKNREKMIDKKYIYNGDNPRHIGKEVEVVSLNNTYEDSVIVCDTATTENFFSVKISDLK